MVRLNNARSIKTLLNRTINQLLNDEIQVDKARCIGYLGSVLIKSLEVEDMSERMDLLEKQILKRG